MHFLYQGLVVIVALLHFAFLILEMFLWTKPFGLKTFAMSAEVAKASQVLAMNQGLYNGFLAVGLLWGLFTSDNKMTIFFLGCVAVAGIFGAFTVSARIFWIQALPAIVAIVLALIPRESV